MKEDYGFPTGIGTPVVLDTAKNVTFVNPNSPFGGLAQPEAEAVLRIGAGLFGIVVGAAIQYVICCQASKRCG